MDFTLNDDQQQLSQSLTRLLADHGSFEQRRAVAATEPGWSPGLWARLATLGVTALGIPESCGGLGGGAADRLVVMQACGHALLLEPYLACAVLGSTAVTAGASAAQKDALLPRMARGELLLAWAHDEAAGRHAPRWVQTQARRDGSRWRLDGSKSCVLHAAAASQLVVSARTHGLADDGDGLALFIVAADDPGVRLRHYRLVDDSPAGDLTLCGAVAQPLGDPTDGAHAAAAIRATVSAGMAAVCADMLGTMVLAFELSTGYVGMRKQFGRSIGEYQAVRHRIAEMAVGLEMARSMAIAAAIAADDDTADAATPPDAAADLPRAKLVIGRQARALCQAAIQLHGGIGMTEEYAVGHCLRRIHVLDQRFGDVHAQAARLALAATPR